MNVWTVGVSYKNLMYVSPTMDKDNDATPSVVLKADRAAKKSDTTPEHNGSKSTQTTYGNGKDVVLLCGVAKSVYITVMVVLLVGIVLGNIVSKYLIHQLLFR